MSAATPACVGYADPPFPLRGPRRAPGGALTAGVSGNLVANWEYRKAPPGRDRNHMPASPSLVRVSYAAALTRSAETSLK